VAGGPLQIGIHPHNAQSYGTNPGKVAEVVRAQVKRTPAARAVGEIGLDYHYDYSPRDVQAVVCRHACGRWRRSLACRS
jgi:TatD DNase family protein